MSGHIEMINGFPVLVADGLRSTAINMTEAIDELQAFYQTNVRNEVEG